MGWSYVYRSRGKKVIHALKEQFEWSGDNGEYLNVIDGSVVKWNTAYLVAETYRGGVRNRFALVCLLHHRHNDFFNFGYKVMDETMGPKKREMPRRLLKLLNDFPPKEGYAEKWREDCWARLKKSA